MGCCRSRTANDVSKDKGSNTSSQGSWPFGYPKNTVAIPEPPTIVPNINPTSKEVKEGPLVYWEEISNMWRDCYAVLHDDSTLVWYKGQPQKKCLGCLELKPYAAFLMAGPFTAQLPNRPEVTAPSSADFLIAIPTARIAEKTHWFLCGNDFDFNDWMTAIVKTFPPKSTPKCKKKRKKKKSSPGYHPAIALGNMTSWGGYGCGSQEDAAVSPYSPNESPPTTESPAVGSSPQHQIPAEVEEQIGI